MCEIDRALVVPDLELSYVRYLPSRRMVSNSLLAALDVSFFDEEKKPIVHISSLEYTNPNIYVAFRADLYYEI